MEDKWAFQATLAGAVRQQVGLELVVAGQGGAARTGDRETKPDIMEEQLLCSLLLLLLLLPLNRRLV